MVELLRRLWKDEAGMTATEYGIIAAVIAAGLLLVIGNFQEQLIGFFQDATTDLESMRGK